MPDQRQQSLLARFRRSRSSATFFLLPLFCLVLIAIAWYEVTTRVEREYQIEVAAIYRENDNLIRAFEDHARQNLQSVDETLLFLKMRFEQQNQVTPEMVDYMQTRRSQLVEEISVYDPFGRIVAGFPHTAKLKPTVHFEIYNAHAKKDSNRLYIGKPVYDHPSSRWSIPVSRRLNHPDGSFAGVVFASLNPYFFFRLLSSDGTGLRQTGHADRL